MSAPGFTKDILLHPKFSEGQRVSVMRANNFATPGGMYRIVRALPLESGQRQYRVRNDAETFDRIVDESRLEPAGLD